MEEFVLLNRRGFLKKTMLLGAASAASSLPLWAQAGKQETRLTILHTNDVHSRIEPFPMDGSKYAGLGGVARRSALIQQVRSEEKNVLLLDSGDMFQGTPYFNLFGGKVELELMSKLGYEAGTFGNHEFDNGIAGLVKYLDKANFPFLTANYAFKGTLLEGRTQEYTIINKNGLRIGITGVGVDIEGLVDPTNYVGMKYLDPIPVVNRIAKMLKEEKKCDLVICLSHLGYDYKDEPNKVSDLKLAAGTRHLDLILGGHTHTFLDKPTVVKNLDGQEVYVNQVGFAGIRLGRLDIVFNKKTGKKQVMASQYTVDQRFDKTVNA